MTREELHNLNHYQLEIIHKYCDDDLHELKKICNRIIRRKNDVFQKDYDDIYDDGMKVLLESVLSYNPDKRFLPVSYCSDCFRHGTFPAHMFQYPALPFLPAACTLPRHPTYTSVI